MKITIESMQFHKFSESFQSFGFRCPKELNPFLNLDVFHMSQPTFPPHPHAGFSAITYLFPESHGEFQNRDSKGDRSRIERGGLHWTQAGSGMLHEEIPTEPGTDCFGLQMFIKMPASAESEPGVAFHLSPSEIPTLREPGLLLYVLTGKYREYQSNLIQTKPLLDFFNIELEKEKKIQLPWKRNQVTLLVCLSGAIEANSQYSIQKNQILVIENGSQDLEVIGKQQSNQFLFLSSEPLAEDYFWEGPFCLSSIEKLQHAKSSYLQGTMGKLERSF